MKFDSPTFDGLPTGGAVLVDKATLCVDCHYITEGPDTCQRCASSAVLPLKPILGVIGKPSTDRLTEWLLPKEVKANGKAAKEDQPKPRILKIVGAR